MQLTQRHVEIVNTLYMANLTLARGDDNQRRQLTQKIDEQICFEFGNRWGMKARAGGSINDASKDSIGYHETDGTVSSWDWQNGSSRAPQIHANQEPDYPHLPLSEATFVSVFPVNHLIVLNPGDEGDNDGVTEGGVIFITPEQFDSMLKTIADSNKELAVVHGEIIRAREQLNGIMQMLEQIISSPLPDFTFPTYEANTVLGKITLTPKK